jgi:hypothetical protein
MTIIIIIIAVIAVVIIIIIIINIITFIINIAIVIIIIIIIIIIINVGTIESNTKAELDSVYNLWVNFAEKYIKQNHSPRPLSILLPITTAVPTSSSISLVAETTSITTNNHFIDKTSIVNDVHINNTTNTNTHLLQRHSSSTLRKTNKNGIGNLSSQGIGNHSLISTSTSSSDTQDNAEYMSDDDDSLSFYDCEDGSMFIDANNINSIYDKKQQLLFHSSSIDDYTTTSNNRSNRNSNSMHYNNNNNNNNSSNGMTKGDVNQPTTIHDLAVTIVETTFVFIEFLFWQVRS